MVVHLCVPRLLHMASNQDRGHVSIAYEGCPLSSEGSGLPVERYRSPLKQPTGPVEATPAYVFLPCLSGGVPPTFQH